MRVTGINNLTRYFFSIRANWTGYSGSMYFDIRDGDVTTLQYGIFDLSVTSPSSGVIRFEWDTHMQSSSEVLLRPASGGNYLRTTGEHGFNHSVLVNGLSPGVLYTYKVISVGTFNRTISDEEQGSITANCIYDIRVEVQDPTHVKISWKTSMATSVPGANIIYYGTVDPTQTLTASGTSTDHYGTLTVTALTSYTYYVRSRINNIDFVSEPAMFIANVEIIDVLVDPNLNETSIGWKTTTRANCEFRYGITQSLGSSASVTSINNSMVHSVSLSGLSGNTTYQYSIKACWTGYSNTTYYDIENGTFNTDEFGIISSSIVERSPLKGRIIIEWETNFNGSSLLYYGDSPSNLNRTAYGADGFSHRIEVNDVVGSGVKYYRIYSEVYEDPDITDWVDGSINCNPIYDIDIELSFRYLSYPYPGYYALEALVEWKSDQQSSFTIYYGINSILEHSLNAQWDHGSEIYSVLISGSTNGGIYLDPDSTYIYKIVGGGFETDIWTFSTNMTISDICILPDFESATVSWSTNMNGACALEYGNGTLSKTVATPSGIGHSVTLDALRGNTNYWFRISAASQIQPGIYHSFIDGTFSTLSFGIVNSSVNGRSPAPGCLELEWQTSLPSQGTVYYGTNPAIMTQYVEVDTEIAHKVLISNLTVDQSYYFRIVAICGSNGSEVVEHVSSAPVEITSVFGIQVDVFSPTEARVHWYTTISSDRGYVEYWADGSPEFSVRNTYRASNGTYFYADLKADRRGDGGLIPNTNYSFRIADYRTDSAIHYFETNVKITDTTVERGYDWLSISWRTNLVCMSTLEYGATADPDQSATASTTQGGRYHTVFIDGLNGDTRYYYTLLSYYSFNAEYCDEEGGTTSTRAFGIMSNTCVLIGADFIEIGWNTSEAASGKVEYGLEGGGLNNLSICQNGTWHYARISELDPNSNYFLRLNSTKAHDENNVSTMNMSLSTSFPSISGVVATVLDRNPFGGPGKSVLFSWTTNFNGTSMVRYDEDGTVNYQSPTQFGGGGYQHYVFVNNLTANLTYYYEVESTSQSNSTYSTSSSVSTVDIRLKISEVRFTPFSGSAAVVSWTTDYLSTSIVHLSTDEGMSGPLATFGNSTETRSHSVLVNGLSLDTTYYFMALSDWTGTLYNDSIRSYDFSIRISDLSVDHNRTSAIISWKTSLESTGEVQFAACSMANATAVWAQSGYSSMFDENGTVHEVVLSSLALDTEYCFRAVSTWVVLSDFIDMTDLGNFSTVLRIMDVSYVLTDTTITITWFTNLDSSSIVRYSIDQSYSSTRTGVCGTMHTVKLSGLNTDTSYQLRIESGDDYGSSSVTLGAKRTRTISVANLEVFENLPSRTIIKWSSSSSANCWLDYSTSSDFSTYSTIAAQKNGNQHQATLTGLSSSQTYFIRAKCQSLSNTNDVQYSGPKSFQPPVTNDASQGIDAPSVLSTNLLRVTTGEFAGSLNSNGDLKDFYSVFARNGQKIEIKLYVATNYNMNLYLYSPSSSTAQTSSASAGNGGRSPLLSILIRMACGGSRLGDIQELEMVTTASIRRSWAVTTNSY